MKLTKRDIDRIYPTQDRSLLDLEKVKVFEAKMRKSGWFGPALVVLWDGWSFSLYTGHHRCEAAKRTQTIPEVIDLTEVYLEAKEKLPETWEKYGRPELCSMKFYEMVDATVLAKTRKKYAMENDLGPIREAAKKKNDRGGYGPVCWISDDVVTMSTESKEARRKEMLDAEKRLKKSVSFEKAKVIRAIGMRADKLGTTLQRADHKKLEAARKMTVRQIVDAHSKKPKTKAERIAHQLHLKTLTSAHRAIEKELVSRMKTDTGEVKSFEGDKAEALALKAARKMVEADPMYVKRCGSKWAVTKKAPAGKHHRVNTDGSIEQVKMKNPQPTKKAFRQKLREFFRKGGKALLKAKYIQRIPKPGGGYKYIYKEPEGVVKKPIAPAQADPIVAKREKTLELANTRMKESKAAIEALKKKHSKKNAISEWPYKDRMAAMNLNALYLSAKRTSEVISGGKEESSAETKDREHFELTEQIRESKAARKQEIKEFREENPIPPKDERIRYGDAGILQGLFKIPKPKKGSS